MLPVLVQANVSLYNLVLPGTRSLTQFSLRLTVTHPRQPLNAEVTEMSYHIQPQSSDYPKGISTNCVFDPEAHHGVL